MDEVTLKEILLALIEQLAEINQTLNRISKAINQIGMDEND